MIRILQWQVVITLAVMLGGCGPQSTQTGDSDLAVLAQGAEEFAQARPGTELRFPRDHGSHPGFRIEWWYLTANLTDANGRPFGVQWTLFRFAVQPPGESANLTPWQDKQLFMAHLGLSSSTDHVGFQRYARGGDHGGIAQAGVRAEPFAAWLDDWSLSSTGSGWLPLHIIAGQDQYAVDLHLASSAPLVLQGDQGFSQKHPGGGGSYYYSQPFLTVSGSLVLDGETIDVSGQGWLDREWSSQFLQPDQAGWDWFALHLDSGEKLMLFRLRQRDDEADFRHGVLIDPDGGKQVLDPDRIQLRVLQKTRVAGRMLPLRWAIELPQIDRSFELSALHPEQWMDVDFPYWEGAVNVQGEGPGNSGRGYMELTGYASDQ